MFLGFMLLAFALAYCSSSGQLTGKCASSGGYECDNPGKIEVEATYFAGIPTFLTDFFFSTNEY